MDMFPSEKLTALENEFENLSRKYKSLELENKKLMKIYHKANGLMAKIHLDGQIDQGYEVCFLLFKALTEFDGGDPITKSN